MLLLISLAGALVYPNLRPHLRRTRREAGMRRLAASLDDLRRQAVAGGRVLVLEYDGDEPGLLRSEKGSADEPGVLPLPERMQVFSMEPPRLFYFPQGHSSGAVLEAGEERERPVRIEVGSFTGLARVVRDKSR